MMTALILVMFLSLGTIVSMPLVEAQTLQDMPIPPAPSPQEITAFPQNNIDEELLEIIEGGHALCTELRIIPGQCVNLIFWSGTLIVIEGDLSVLSTEPRRSHNNVIWLMAHNIAIRLGYTIEDVLLTGQGSQGNPHSVMVVMTKYS